MTVDEMIDAGSEWVDENIDPAAIEAGSQWAEDNIDEDVLRVLKDVDRKTVRDFLQNVQKEFRGGNAVDMDKLKPMAGVTVKLLEAHPETQPYAEWLKTRLDYFQVAAELRTMAPPPPTTAPETVQPPIPTPAPEKERKVWKKKIERRPLPKGAKDLAARLKPIFIAQQVPGQLVWLAEVESSFAPRAKSPAGAAGLYQLMPATARSLGLSLFPRDQRYDPEKNARAAARYLKALHNRFKDWSLALAAYNAGESRLQTLLKKHEALTYDQVSMHLPAETQMYVPKINATLLRREGISLADLRFP